MKKLIFLVWILTLAACSGKKTTPVSENDDRNQNGVYMAEAQEDYYIAQESYALISAPNEDEDGYLYNPRIYYGHLSVSASSELSDSQGSYPAGNLIDQTWRSWAVRNGIGESFTLEYIYSEETVTGFALKNGYGNLDHYSANNRVKSFSIYVNGNYTETIPVKDSISFEQYYLKEPVKIGTIRFVIDDVYPGTTYNETCVAEIALFRHTVSDRRFYDEILLWISADGDEQGIAYENNQRGMASVSDIDRLLLRDYLPFDISGVFFSWDYYNYDTKEWRQKKSKIALLDIPSSLRLNNNLPRLDGATAMYPLYSSFVRAVYPEISIEKNDIKSLFEWPYNPNRNLLLNDWEISSESSKEPFPSIVQCNTTSEAYQRLINGETDIIFCYEPSQAEISAAREKGLQFSLTPIAKDAFVFIVNNKNVLNNITQNQIRDIYSGRTTNWKEISGVDEPVIAYQRRENSGSQTTLQSIMGKDLLTRPILEDEYIPSGMFGMINSVASTYYNYNSAIGYTFLFYLTKMADDSGTKFLAVDGIAPTRQTIQNNTYPFTQTVYAITTGNESENTRRFITWILSAQGQELVAKTGYTPVR